MSLKIIQIDEGHERSMMLAQSIIDCGYDVIARISSNDDIVTTVNKFDPDLIMLDVEIPETQMLDQLYQINQIKPKPIVMFSDKGDPEMIDAVVKAGVSAYVVDGLTAKRIKPVIDIALARFRELQSLREELLQSKETLSERKIIDKAKGIIMKQKKMSEDDAYNSLRKLAMDRNQKMRDVARNVIEVSELLI